MGAKTIRSRVGGAGYDFRGLSDRSIPVQLSRAESPDLLNCEFYGRALERRNGYTRIGTTPMRNASARFDGVNDYLRIPYINNYILSAGLQPYVSIGVRLNARPTSDVTIVSKGYGARTAPTNQFRLEYRPTADTTPVGGTPSVLGAWWFTYWDLANAASRTCTINDGDGVLTPAGQFRYLEFYGENGSGQAIFKMWDTSGNVSTAPQTTQAATWQADTSDITVGVSMSAANVIGTDFAPATMCELRFGRNSIAQTSLIITTANLLYKTELSDGNTVNTVGYWKMNDGTSGIYLADSSPNANSATIPQNPSIWITDSTKVMGQSGLQFNGGSSFVYMRDLGATSVASQVFSNAGGGPPNGYARWAIRLIVVPILPPNLSAQPDSTILWGGGDAAIPAPVSIQVVSDKFVFKYRDGINTRTVTLATPNVSSLTGKRVRMACWRDGTGTGNFNAAIAYLVGSTYTQSVGTAVACTAATPSVASIYWTLGRHMVAASATAPLTVPYSAYTAGAGDGSWNGVIDDFQIIWNNSLTATTNWLMPLNTYNAFAEFSNWAFQANLELVCYLPMNEGGGSVINNTGSRSYTTFLLPEADDGIHPDMGLVDSYRPVECGGIFQYAKFLTDGSSKRTTVVVSGSTFYEVDTTAGTVTAVGGGLYQGPSGTKWTATQYAQRLYMAAPNGRGPVKWDGANVQKVGIERPYSPPQLTTKNTGGATFSGNYYFYVTYRNKEQAVESNPTIGQLVNFPGGAGANSIDAIVLPVSPDPQVNQRRVWMTSGADGSTAYLLLTVDDNTTVTWTPDITAPVNTGLTLLYYTNDVPPAASCVRVFRDSMFAGGNQRYPTRLWRSAIGAVDAWDQTVLYIDLDLDNGNPITALDSLNNRLLVHMRRGLAGVWNTGDSNNPIGFDFINRDHGAIGPAASVIENNKTWYFSERDIWTSDGSQEANVSSSFIKGAASIQTTVRSSINASRLRSICAMSYTLKNQIWFAVSSTGSTRNDTVYVLDFSQGTQSQYYLAPPSGVWSKYDLNLDCMAAIDDNSDANAIYGVIEGYVCKLDTPTYDGVSAVQYGLVTSGTTTGFSTGTSLTNVLPGMRVSVYSVAGNVVGSGIVQAVSGSAVSLYSAFTNSVTPANNDIWSVGGIPWYADFVVDYGDPTKTDRLRWLRLAGDSDNDANMIRVSIKADNPGRTFNYTNVTEYVKVWGTATKSILIHVGKVAASFRVRISDTGLSSAASPQPVPNPFGGIKVYQWELEAEELEIP